MTTISMVVQSTFIYYYLFLFYNVLSTEDINTLCYTEYTLKIHIRSLKMLSTHSNSMLSTEKKNPTIFNFIFILSILYIEDTIIY